MCQAVERGTERFSTLAEMMAAGILRADQIPSDPELEFHLRLVEHLTMFDVCFCNVDVEDILDRAGIQFKVLGDGDLELLP